jgi:hypothetical protein
VAAEYATLKAQTDELAALRNELVLEATRQGMSRRLVADLARLSPGRIQQLIDEKENSAAGADLARPETRVPPPPDRRHLVASDDAEPIGPAGASATRPPQHLLALHHANRVRLARAELKRKVAKGQVSAADVVLDCPWEAASMEIGDVLMSQRRWGRARCRRLLLSLGLPENKQIGTLTIRQRQALASVLVAKDGAKEILAAEAASARAT